MRAFRACSLINGKNSGIKQAGDEMHLDFDGTAARFACGVGWRQFALATTPALVAILANMMFECGMIP